MRPKGKGLKLHLGCGDYWFEGYINIDFNVYGGTDMLYDIRQKLPFQDQTVEIIEAYEVLEHMNKYEISDILQDWERLLINGGKISISVPDIELLIDSFYNAKQEEERATILLKIYGYEDHPHHKIGYTMQSLGTLFEQHHFSNIKVERGHLPERPDELQLLLNATYDRS